MATATTEFALGDIVYLKVRDDRLRGMVTRITLYPGGVIYMVSWADGSDNGHYGIELSAEFEADFG